jgi:glutamate N-acetyltransferase/amino-acid N-acetyltransferase
MIMPDMATMLCFVVTDADIARPVLQNALSSGVERSFNRITVDGDTSTNDMVLVMANGAADNRSIIEDNGEAFAAFAGALHAMLRELAEMIVADGEGATKCVTVRVTGAPSDDDALAAARTIAGSALVKTAFFGEDANRGRIIAALGRSDCPVVEERVAIFFDDVCMARNGLGLGPSVEEAATEVLRRDKFTVLTDLGSGSGSAEVLTCDFSYDYVKINADYRT